MRRWARKRRAIQDDPEAVSKWTVDPDCLYIVRPVRRFSQPNRIMYRPFVPHFPVAVILMGRGKKRRGF
jgi:hypothetical protein